VLRRGVARTTQLALTGTIEHGPVQTLTTEVEWDEPTPQRLDSLRTLLREYLHALDSHDEFVADMLARCAFGPRVGRAVLLIPLARLPAKRS
jgi:hypothetical protein